MKSDEFDVYHAVGMPPVEEDRETIERCKRRLAKSVAFVETHLTETDSSRVNLTVAKNVVCFPRRLLRNSNVSKRRRRRIAWS